jgi:hypothetical protein
MSGERFHEHRHEILRDLSEGWLVFPRPWSSIVSVYGDAEVLKPRALVERPTDQLVTSDQRNLGVPGPRAGWRTFA